MKNSEQEKLDQQELRELFRLRDKLVEAMKPLFGEYQEKMERITFKDWKNKKIAELLDCSNIGRYLQKPNLNDKSQPKQDAFNGLISKVEFFSQHLEKPLKENVSLRDKLKISLISLSSILLLTIGLAAFWKFNQVRNNDSYQEKIKAQTQKIADLNHTIDSLENFITPNTVNDEGMFSQIFATIGEQNAQNLGNEAYNLSADARLKVQNGDTLTKEDKIAIITFAQDLINNTVLENRLNFRKKNYQIVFQKKINIVDIIENAAPRESFFKYLPKEIVELNSVPPNGSAYDIGLYKVKDYLIGTRSLPQKEFEKIVMASVIQARNETHSKAKTCFRTFIKTGELCDKYQ